jgi:FkbM family methyltransferase
MNIEFLKYENNRIYYRNITDDIIYVRIDVYDNYSNSFMFSNELDLGCNGEYFTYIPFVWNITEIYIYDRINNELLCNFNINGNRKLNEYDEYGYILRLFQLEKGKIIQSSLNQLVGEHFYNREYENIIDIEENDIVVDVGFNYGIFSLFALYNKAKKIYGFEPNKDIYNKIKNIYPEKDKVEIFNYAISDQNKKIIFYSTEDTVASSITMPIFDSKSYEVQCINLYDFIIENNIEKIDFLKIDCEGEEYRIFESIPDSIFSKIKKVMVEFHFNDGVKINILIDKLNRLNFEWYFSFNVNYNSDGGLIFAKNKNII